MVIHSPVTEFFERDAKKLKSGMIVNTVARGAMKQFLDSRGFVEINPVIISPISDPLNHPVDDPIVNYYGHEYGLTKSMIFHKQLALNYFDRIYSFSPNIRLEPLERSNTGRHLAEFTQLDLEVRNKKREYVMELAEGMINHAIEKVKKNVDPTLVNPLLEKYPHPFKRVKYFSAFEKYGHEFEKELSIKAKEPFWIIDIPLEEREFYDKEKEDEPGILRDMDLIYPYGFGEAISGGEREHEFDKILKRIQKKGQKVEQFSLLLEASKKGIYPSAGFGIGIERFVRFLTGVEEVSEVTLFPKKIGKFVL